MYTIPSHGREGSTAAALAEIEHGLRCARGGHYCEAATHFSRARQNLPLDRAELLASLDAVLDGHSHYQQAYDGLHAANHHLALITVEQQKRLDDLQTVLVAPVNAPLTSAAMRRPGEHAPLTLIPGRGSTRASDAGDALPLLRITCFGRFGVWRSGQPVELCPNRNGQAILRYLAAHAHHRGTSDELMDALWPDDQPDTARHKLHCAVSALRRVLNAGYVQHKGAGYLLHEHGLYQLGPAGCIEIDADELLAQYGAGQRAQDGEAVDRFEAACRLYTGPFLPEDLYADWSRIRREQLTQAYLAMCARLAAHYERQGRFDVAAGWALKILEENRCDELAYQQLIHSYAAAGRRGEAIRHYEICRRVLAEELAVEPMPDTTALYQCILRGEALPSLPAMPVMRGSRFARRSFG
jgi:DNA-binding SARP family transcriptional activator